MKRITLTQALKMVNKVWIIDPIDAPVTKSDVVSYKRNKKSYTLVLPAAVWRVTERRARFERSL